MKIYNASGYVMGNNWGGGKSGYPAEKYSDFKTRKELTDEIEKDFKSGALDSGMGYESLTATVMDINCIETREIEGKEFVNSEIEEFELGNEDDIDSLKEMIFEN